MRVTAKTVGMSKKGGDTIVEVMVIGPEGAPSGAKETRARAQALVDAGPASVATRAAGDVTAGEIQRMTELIGERDVTGQRRAERLVEQHFPDWVRIPDGMKLQQMKYDVRVKQ